MDSSNPLKESIKMANIQFCTYTLLALLISSINFDAIRWPTFNPFFCGSDDSPFIFVVFFIININLIVASVHHVPEATIFVVHF